jgi:hypothetical protein
MTINFAVDRLYETGWLPGEKMELDRLPNGLRYPTVTGIQKIFGESGLKLSITPHLMFGCYRAEWSPLGNHQQPDGLTGTVVGSCDREAAVHALATLREQQVDLRLSGSEKQSALMTV